MATTRSEKWRNEPPEVDGGEGASAEEEINRKRYDDCLLAVSLNRINIQNNCCVKLDGHCITNSTLTSMRAVNRLRPFMGMGRTSWARQTPSAYRFYSSPAETQYENILVSTPKPGVGLSE